MAFDWCNVQLFKRQITAGNQFVNGTQGSFHNTASRSENICSARTQTHRGIELRVIDICKINPAFSDHACQLPYCQNRIHISHAAVHQLRTGDLKFLRGTRHDRNYIHALRVDIDFVSIVAFDQSAKHHMRGFACGEVARIFRVPVLQEFDPSRAAAGDHRKHGPAACENFFRSRQEFTSFFHDSNVSRKVRIKNIIKIQFLQGSCQLPGDRCPRGDAKFIADPNSDSRRDLYDHTLCRISNSIPHVLDAGCFA